MHLIFICLAMSTGLCVPGAPLTLSAAGHMHRAGCSMSTKHQCSWWYRLSGTGLRCLGEREMWGREMWGREMGGREMGGREMKKPPGRWIKDWHRSGMYSVHSSVFSLSTHYIFHDALSPAKMSNGHYGVCFSGQCTSLNEGFCATKGG